MVTGESFLNGDEGSFSEVLSSRGEFPEDWLSRGSKSIVPVAAGKQMDQALLQRIVKGCQSQRVDDILIAAVEEGLIKRPRRLSGLGSAAVSLEGAAHPSCWHHLIYLEQFSSLSPDTRSWQAPHNFSLGLPRKE